MVKSILKQNNWPEITFDRFNQEHKGADNRATLKKHIAITKNA